MDAYREESHRIMEIIASTGAVVEQMSVDEAYLDMSGICQAETMAAALELARTLAAELKRRIKAERQLTATIGIASNKLLAKIASDHQKPDGLTVITDEQRVPFLRPLPVRTLYGVGKVTEQVLNRAVHRHDWRSARLPGRFAGTGRFLWPDAEKICRGGR